MEKDSIGKRIAEIQAKLLIKKAKDGALDLHREIEENDISNLTTFINNELFSLMQSGNQETKTIVNKITCKMIDRLDAVYDPEIWRLLAIAKNENIEEQDKSNSEIVREDAESNVLLPTVIKEHRRLQFSNLIRINK